MPSKDNLSIASDKQKSETLEHRLPSGVRRHIRRLKQQGNLKEATSVRNAAFAIKTETTKKPD